MNEPTHSPTPWRIAREVTQTNPPECYESAIFTDWDFVFGLPVASCAFPGIGGQEMSEANAAFIVLAVNAHEELVSVMQEVCLCLEAGRMGQDRPLIQAMRSALAKAKNHGLTHAPRHNRDEYAEKLKNIKQKKETQ